MQTHHQHLHTPMIRRLRTGPLSGKKTPEPGIFFRSISDKKNLLQAVLSRDYAANHAKKNRAIQHVCFSRWVPPHAQLVVCGVENVGRKGFGDLAICQQLNFSIPANLCKFTFFYAATVSTRLPTKSRHINFELRSLIFKFQRTLEGSFSAVSSSSTSQGVGGAVKDTNKNLNRIVPRIMSAKSTITHLTCAICCCSYMQKKLKSEEK